MSLSTTFRTSICSIKSRISRKLFSSVWLSFLYTENHRVKEEGVAFPSWVSEPAEEFYIMEGINSPGRGQQVLCVCLQQHISLSTNSKVVWGCILRVSRCWAGLGSKWSRQGSVNLACPSGGGVHTWES
jgi:hypothetical protein